MLNNWVVRGQGSVCFDKQGVNLQWFQNLLILGIIPFLCPWLSCPCSQKADRRKSQDKQGSKAVVLTAAPWHAAFGGSRKQARKALKLERLLWRGSSWNSSLRAPCVLLGLTEDNCHCPMEPVGNRINCKMPGNLDSPDMELEEPQIGKHSFYLLPLHHTCYSLTRSAVQESNLFNHTPFSISVLPRPNLLATIPCAISFWFPWSALLVLPPEIKLYPDWLQPYSCLLQNAEGLRKTPWFPLLNHK